jgi:aryl-alcohol dehydrogenase-like predicted oxidoreductase
MVEVGRTISGVTREIPTGIGLGLAALGRPGYLNLGHGDDLGEDRSVEALERRTHEVLDFAFQNGVRYFDAARSYGLAERFLGSWLTERGLAPGDTWVASKWGYTYTADWQVDADPPEVKDLSADTFRRQLAETRELLGDHLCLYQIHSATKSSGVLDDEALRDEMAELRSTGVLIGLTTTGTEQADTIDRALEVGGFDTVQSTWNLIERSAGPALQRAHDAGLHVIVKEALANGRLTARGGENSPGDALALASVLAQPFVDVALSGASTAEQLDSNLSAYDIEWTPEQEERYAGLVEPPEEYWEKRSELAWT